MSVPRRAGLPPGVRRIRLPGRGAPLAGLVADPSAAPGPPALGSPAPGSSAPGAGSSAATGSPGAARTVLCVPGYTGSKEDFAPLLPLLAAAGYAAYAYDQRGQYQSPGPDDPDAYRRDALAAELAALAASLGPVHLVGHSYGGIVARAAVLDHGLRPASLTLLGSGPAAIQGPRRALTEGMRPLLDSGGVAAVWAAAEELAAADPRRADTPAEVTAFLRERFLAGSAVGLRVMGEDLCTEPDRTDKLGRTGVPLLVAHGAGDDAWPPPVQREMARRLGAAYAVIPDALHSPAVEAPEATAAVLVGFWQARRD